MGLENWSEQKSCSGKEAGKLGRDYKTVRNSRGTWLEIGPESYISVGQGGKEVMMRGGGMVIAFPSWEDIISAIDVSRSPYYKGDGAEK